MANNDFTFDRVLGENSEQSEVFEHVGRNVTEACLEGYNGCIFSYGQTGSGKTFTIMGDEKNTGLLPRVVKHMFERIEDDVLSTKCKVSFLEIYNEQLRDLLAEMPRGAGVLVEGKVGLTSHIADVLRKEGRPARFTATKTHA